MPRKQRFKPSRKPKPPTTTPSSVPSIPDAPSQATSGDRTDATISERHPLQTGEADTER